MNNIKGIYEHANRWEARFKVGVDEKTGRAMIGFIQGLTIGCSVVIARFIGARDHKMTSLAVHTTVALGLVSSLVLTLV